MGSTRDLVLEHILKHQNSTINDLAEAVEINPISVRHHIGRLEEEGLVASREEKHGVGRPRRVYYLTERGIERFPARTVRFTNQLLDGLKKEFGPDEYGRIFDKLASNLAESYLSGTELEKLNTEERLALIREWLTNEGFNVTVERDDNEIIIKETSCPYYYVGQAHAEVCTIDKTMISKVLDVDPERTTCILNGDSHCTYVVPLSAIKEVA
ncbi:MAG: helix-turn-helix transcriptional regulator [Anaerolineales bacterium]